MSLSSEFIYEAGKTHDYVADAKAAGVTHIIMANGNYATRPPELRNVIVSGLQWSVDNFVRNAPKGTVYGIVLTSDANSLLAQNPNEKLHPSYTKMDEIERVSFVLDAVRAQFTNRSDGLNIDCRAYLYDGSPAVPDNGRKELKIVTDAGIVADVTIKGLPWGLEHPFGSPLWLKPEFKNMISTTWTDPSQGSIMEQFYRAARAAEIGDTVTPEAIQHVMDLVAAGKIKNLHDHDAILFGNDKKSIPDLNGNPIIIKPEIGPHGGPYMESAKPHRPLYPVEPAARQYLLG